ncbi:aspartate-semialdehyde dehydrogenase [Candidatus Micrarchaeota archaeon]|nr:aspartate-semialdehyde dehydrogenase [Candidatus Micrarchaeota archaeon]
MKVAILAATGSVGQRFVQLLEGHPWFEVSVLAASERSVGKKYSEACHWLLDTPMPDKVKDIVVVDCKPENMGGAGFVFSCLPGELAGPVEEEMAKAGYPVISKASGNRLKEDVPLIVSEVNSEHLGLIEVQRKKYGRKGFISTDPNCSTAPLVMCLKPLMKYGIKRVHVATMQALSGAGYLGVASMDAVGNVVPYIGGEEEKIETEALKMLGTLKGGKVENAPIVVSASCNRVPVIDGHTESVFVEFAQDVSVEQILKEWEAFEGEPQKLKLPSAHKAIVYRTEPNRPQPRLDVMEGKGMSTVVGRLRKDGPNRIKFTCLSHNTIRGAAGNGILHAELLKAKGVLG